jgi:hypothetical protein
MPLLGSFGAGSAFGKGFGVQLMQIRLQVQEQLVKVLMED